MINILSYIGMNMQSEVCLWTLLGLIRTIFDATLFRMNANLKQVWQMTMPEQLSMPVQRTLRTMISGVMLVQCFTVYVYLASYIVLLYPVFLEERPALVLPWLLLAAIRKLLCELTSLALGLGTCVLVGPTRPPCIKFVIIKLISIMPAFYNWMLLFSYYHTLKLAAAFKTFPAVLPASDHDYGLELAIRRRRTKSLLGEEQLRSKLVANLYGEPSARDIGASRSKIGISSRMIHSTDTSTIDFKEYTESLRPLSAMSKQISETSREDWFGSEVVVPRDTDRILEQFVLMMLRIGDYLHKEGVESITSQMFDKNSMSRSDNLPCPTISLDESETPPQIGSIGGNTASYLREYPQIFMKKSADVSRSDNGCGALTEYVQSRLESDEDTKVLRPRRRTVSTSSKERDLLDTDKATSRKKNTPQEKDQHGPSSSTKVSDILKQKLLSDNLSTHSNYSEDTTNTNVLPNDEANVSPSSSAVNESQKSNDNSPNNKQSKDSTKKSKID